MSQENDLKRGKLVRDRDIFYTLQGKPGSALFCITGFKNGKGERQFGLIGIEFDNFCAKLPRIFDPLEKLKNEKGTVRMFLNVQTQRSWISSVIDDKSLQITNKPIWTRKTNNDRNLDGNFAVLDIYPNFIYVLGQLTFISFFWK